MTKTTPPNRSREEALDARLRGMFAEIQSDGAPPALIHLIDALEVDGPDIALAWRAGGVRAA